MFGEWEIARPYNFLLLPMVDPGYGIAFHRQTNEKVLLVRRFSSKQEEMVRPGMRKRPQHQEIWNAQLQEDKREYSLQRRFFFPIRTFARSVSTTSRSEKPSSRRKSLHGRNQRFAKTFPRNGERDSSRGEGNRSQMGRRRWN